MRKKPLIICTALKCSLYLGTLNHEDESARKNSSGNAPRAAEHLVQGSNQSTICWSATSSYPLYFSPDNNCQNTLIQESVKLDFSSGEKEKGKINFQMECASCFAHCIEGFRPTHTKFRITFDRQSKVEQYISPQITTLFCLVQLKYKLIRLHVPLRLEQKAQDQLCHCH